MKILSYNPGHDGAIAYVKDGQLLFSIESEKNSNYRYSSISNHDVFRVLGELDEIPDVICVGGWWPRDHYEYLNGSNIHSGYRGESGHGTIIDKKKFLGHDVHYFSSTHERSHILCAYGLSNLPKGTPCYILVWEGAIGTFYEIDSDLNITLISNVLEKVGNRYSLLYGLADPTFPKEAPYFRFEDAGKLMALASFSDRKEPSEEDKNILELLLGGPYKDLSTYENLKDFSYYNIGLDNLDFRNFAGIYSDKIFDIFYQFADKNMKRGFPLLIAGGCGLNCDWNTKWKQSGLFSDVFVPPVANDSGSAIGTAIDAQFYYTGNPKIDWSVYSGLNFDSKKFFDETKYDTYDVNDNFVADILANDLILAWVNGKYEIGPRALGNRSIIAAPFSEGTRIRLNEIKQREQFRPIAPVCLEEDAAEWFGCEYPSPHMLYTFIARTDALKAVTHVNKTARIQTVSQNTNLSLFKLLTEFKKLTGYGILCNTSLNFNGRGFINKIDDLSRYCIEHHLDGFVTEEKCYLLKASQVYQTYKALGKIKS
ncbi:carbamoyltransferase C-terminal domain-containing protein [Pedobacter antarcticus]|uniref:carbamoyltransferase C-terminal domain-containing protein n=1 Tax=Pedobacter antarcticus TaxID=34086 RepID=UPI00089165D0|nr:carbamoyltransferase C-terminal domain-containing protein [Pedobacter antarcticus]SDL55644.1 hydroxymethyl cephem carbamoyltransferase [Pedobacter antarcticus]